MSTMLMATDYSRPIQHLFEQTIQVGSVHSVFRRAMNIEFGDTLLSVLSDELPHMPNSVRLPAPQAERLFAGVRPGMPAFVGNDYLANRTGHPQGDAPTMIRGYNGARIIVGASPCGCPVILSIPVCDCYIALPPKTAWEPRPQLGMLSWRRDRVARHTDTLAWYLVEVAQEEGLAALVGPLLLGKASRMTVLTQRALPMLHLLMQAGVERKREGAERAAKGLLGLGPGLTPSGDDVLAGYMAVLVLLSARFLSVDGLSREEIGLWITALAPSRTTRLSAALLTYAARGEVAEQLGGVLIALASPVEATKAVLHAADDLLQFGATSGGDTLLGVLLGLRVLGGVL